MCTLLNIEFEDETNLYFNSSEFIKGINYCRKLLQLNSKLGEEIPSWSKGRGKYEIHHWDNFEVMGIIS